MSASGDEEIDRENEEYEGSTDPHDRGGEDDLDQEDSGHQQGVGPIDAQRRERRDHEQGQRDSEPELDLNLGNRI